VGGRLGARRAGPHEHGARLGETPRARSVTPSTTASASPKRTAADAAISGMDPQRRSPLM
jgi:hypothetical protein